MTTATPPPPSPLITAADLLAAVWRHGLTLVRGTTLAQDACCCCAVGAMAVLFDPEMARDGTGMQARLLVWDRIGTDAANGLENGFEGWPDEVAFRHDQEAYDHWRAIGEALAREAGVVSREDRP